mmetsp:Transcript_127679/g.361340  ORF Transcript_127679/g.361340 Transcript_127679/m.361340 type:complete len:217 (-) Transcript_127679:15-665(-)
MNAVPAVAIYRGVVRLHGRARVVRPGPEQPRERRVSLQALLHQDRALRDKQRVLLPVDEDDPHGRAEFVPLQPPLLLLEYVHVDFLPRELRGIGHDHALAALVHSLLRQPRRKQHGPLDAVACHLLAREHVAPCREVPGEFLEDLERVTARHHLDDARRRVCKYPEEVILVLGLERAAAVRELDRVEGRVDDLAGVQLHRRHPSGAGGPHGGVTKS